MKNKYKNKYYLVRENDEFELVIAYIETYKELLHYLGIKKGSLFKKRKNGFKVNNIYVFVERYINDKLMWSTKNEKKS